MSKAKNLPLLMQVFEFTEEDLQENEAGNLTAKQIKRLNKLYLQTHLSGFTVTVLITLFSGILCVPVAFNANLSAIERIVLILCFSVFPALFIFWHYIKWVRLGLAQEYKKVNKCCGMIVLRHPRKRQVNVHTAKAGIHRFIITSSQFFALENGASYCIYYAPNTKYILAVKPLEMDEYFFDESRL